MAFLDGLPPEKLCQPIVDHFTQRGGEIRCHAHLSHCMIRPLALKLVQSIKHVVSWLITDACCSMVRHACPALLSVLNLHLATALQASTGPLLMSSFCLYRMNAKLKEIELNDDDSVKRFRMADGSTLEGDLYVSAMPGTIHICRPSQ